MNTVVIDASIAVKWVVEEEGTPEALALRHRSRLIAPELLAAECANILWKKVRREELSREEALFAAGLLQAADIEFRPAHHLLERRPASQWNSIIPRTIASTSRWRMSWIAASSLRMSASSANSIRRQAVFAVE